MAKWRAEVMGPWIIDPNGQRSKQLSRDYAGCFISDITGQSSKNLMPDPNLVIVLVTCEEAVLDAIEADNAYHVVLRDIVEEEGTLQALGVTEAGKEGKSRKGKKDKPDKQQKKALKDFLKARKQKGKTKSEWDAIVEGLVPDDADLTYGEISERLQEWMREFPKAMVRQTKRLCLE